jgi:uncharacterized protein (DUF58 family)
LTAATKPAPDPALTRDLVRALDLVVRRRVEGLLAGDHPSVSLGQGTDLARVRPYEAGDDVRFIDWNVTARTADPHVRVHVAEKALTTWLVLDGSASMHFGTADRTKAELAESLALVVGHLACRGANRLGVITFGGAAPVTLPAASSRAGLIGLLTALRQQQLPVVRVEQRDRAATATTSDLTDALDRTVALSRRGGLVVVIADFREGGDWSAAMTRLCQRHDVVAVEIVDRREQELPNVGDLCLVDPETGRRLRVDTRSRALRERFADAARTERAGVAARLTRAGADHVVLTTEGDWLRPFAAFLHRREHAR